MPNQSDFERINRLVIQPLAINYNTKFPDAMIDAMVEDLSAYDDSTLEKAVGSVRRTCKMPPRIAHLVEACEEFKPAGSRTGSSDPYRNLLASQNARADEARRHAMHAVNGDAGQAAVTGGYYTELFGYLYDTALAQLTAGKPVDLQIPNPLPQRWLNIGDYRKERSGMGRKAA